MANIVITKETNRFKVTSNDVSTGWLYDYVWPDDIEHVQRNGAVVLSFRDERHDWELSPDGADGTWQVDTVDSVTITTLDGLAAAIANMKGA